MESRNSNQQCPTQPIKWPCLPILLAGATMLIAAVVVLVPLILHFWDSELFRRRQFAMKQVLSVLDDHSVLGAPQNMQGLEEMLRERAEGRDSCFSLYRIESDDVYIILLVPRPLMGEDSPYPVVYLSKDKLEALERLQPEKLNY